MIYARVRDLGVDDIAGMSGGPVLGFKRMPDGSLRSWVVGVQSGWVRSRREPGVRRPSSPFGTPKAIDESERRLMLIFQHGPGGGSLRCGRDGWPESPGYEERSQTAPRKVVLSYLKV